jgi:hypothetical protein
MSGMQCLDTSFGDTQRDSTEAGVREHASLQNKRNPNWPFLYYESGGVTYTNIAPRKPAYIKAQEIGEALI